MKQAYLICAHNNFKLLEILIAQLDYPENDIFIHIDKKVGCVDLNKYEHIAKYSKVICLSKRIDIVWGGYSQPRGNILLIETALKHGSYEYLHLISGVDFPIKSNTYINNFLEAYKGYEFVGYSGWHKTLEYKLGIYHLIPMNFQRKYAFFKYANKVLLKVQNILGIHNQLDTKSFAKGCNWWSITGCLAKDIVDHKDEFEKTYKYTLCSDEIFLQTFLLQNGEKYKIYDPTNEYNSCLRLIDWKKGNPYVWKKTDIDEIMSSKAIFARKFSEDDLDVIYEIQKRIQ